MNFLFPGFLFALAAVIIPVLIHLFNFRKFKKVYFSNVRFLKSVEQQTTSAQKVRNRLILLCRTLAVVFIVLAFARPYIPDGENISGGKPQVVSIYIDNSYSLETVNRSGSLLDEAKRRAREIAAAYGLNDKFHLLTNDFEGAHQRLLTYEDFIEAVEDVKISSNSRSIRQIVNRQSEIFVTEPKARKTVFIISDFQKNLLDNEKTFVDSTVSIRLVQLKANALPNISVDSVWFTSPVHRQGETEKLVVRLQNNSEETANNVPIKLTINGQQKALGSISIAARSTAADTLSFSGLPSGWQQGEISISDYPVTFDDRFYFSFRVYTDLPVLAINGSSINTYLQALFRSDAFFSLENVSAGGVNYSALNSFPLIILNEVQNISSGLSQSLSQYVKAGGSLVVFPSTDGDLTSFKAFLQTLGTDLPEEIVSGEGKVVTVNFEHPVFEGVFERVPQNLELPAAKKYVRYVRSSGSAKRSIMDFAGGRTFFAEYPSARGKVYLSAVPLNEEGSNLVKHSIFVPLMYQTALSSMKSQRLFYELGRDQLLTTNKVVLSAGQTLKLGKDGFEAIPEVRQTESGSLIYVADQMRESGNYTLTRGDSLLAMISFNDNRTESDLSYATSAELTDQFSGSEPEIFEPMDASIQNAVAASNFGTQLWKVCLILTLIFLVSEAVLVRFYNKIQPSNK